MRRNRSHIVAFGTKSKSEVSLTRQELVTVAAGLVIVAQQDLMLKIFCTFPILWFLPLFCIQWSAVYLISAPVSFYLFV